MNFYKKKLSIVHRSLVSITSIPFLATEENAKLKILFEAKRLLYNNLWPPTDLLFLLYTVLMAFVVYTDF